MRACTRAHMRPCAAGSHAMLMQQANRSAPEYAYLQASPPAESFDPSETEPLGSCAPLHCTPLFSAGGAVRSAGAKLPHRLVIDPVASLCASAECTTAGASRMAAPVSSTSFRAVAAPDRVAGYKEMDAAEAGGGLAAPTFLLLAIEDAGLTADSIERCCSAAGVPKSACWHSAASSSSAPPPVAAGARHAISFRCCTAPVGKGVTWIPLLPSGDSCWGPVRRKAFIISCTPAGHQTVLVQFSFGKPLSAPAGKFK